MQDKKHNAINAIQCIPWGRPSVNSTHAIYTVHTGNVQQGLVARKGFKYKTTLKHGKYNGLTKVIDEHLFRL